MARTGAVLEARHVWKWLGADQSGPPALRDVSLRIPAGSWIAITGPSGSGKTTLLSLLGALDRPSRGQILFDGEDLTGFSDIALAKVRRQAGFVFQEFALIPRLPLWENVTYPLVPRGIRAADRRRQAEAVLERVGLGGFADKSPEELSGGERQRAAIARALAGDPVVLIADEPTSNLDPAAAAIVRNALRALRAGGATLIMATHDERLASEADQIHALRDGAMAGRPVQTSADGSTEAAP